VANKKRRQKKLKRQAAAASGSRSETSRLDQEDAGTQQGVATPAAGGAAAATTPRPGATPAARQGGTYARGVTGPRRGGQQGGAVTTIDIDSRVPYFSSDLRRIGITALIMFAVIVVASFFIH
jgi:hypothetical protein